MPCTARPACVISPLALADVPAPTWDGPARGRKAVAVPGLRRIYLDRTFWEGLRGVDARAAVLAHEIGHLEGARCESCADYRAGVWLRELGFPTSRDARRGFLTVLQNRDAVRAQAELAAGYEGAR